MLTRKFKWSNSSHCFHLFLVFLFFLPGYVFAQSGTGKELPSTMKWELDATVSGVKFYHAMSECEGRKVVFLKFDNTNKFSVKAAWKEKFDTQLEIKTIGANGLKEMVLPTGVTQPSGCNENNAARRPAVITALDVQPHYVAQIKKFEYVGILVEKAK